jgi:hypothetical protein
MFKPHIGICICHGQEQLIVVKKGYCAIGNHEQKQAKKKAAGKKTGGYKYVREATGEGSVFEEILNEREPVCFVCGEPITLIMPHNFMHILPKGKYEAFRLYKPNIQLACFKVIAENDGNGKPSNGHHYDWDFKPKSELRENPLFDKVFELEESLIKEHNEWKANQPWQ